MIRVLGILLLVVFSLCTTSAATNYTNHKVYDVSPSKGQLKSLMEWEFAEGIDFWTYRGVKGASRIMVSPDVEDAFEKFLLKNKIQHNISVKDVEMELLKDKVETLKGRAKAKAANDVFGFNFGLFWSLAEIEEYSIKLAAQYPSLVKRKLIGKSVENRDIFALEVSSGTTFGNNPIIYIDSGTHAREWAGIMSVLYLIHELVENSTYTQELVSKVDWVFVPVVNPDGYVYSFTEDRLWRKNRRVVNYTCTGIDLNRNYGYVWEEGPGCTSLGYPGPSPISEPEIQATTAYMVSFKHNLRMYLSVHTYGNYVLYPYGFDFNVYIKNWKEHLFVAQKWYDAIYNATGQKYDIGNSADLLYTANGASDDFAAAKANANLAFTLELTGGGNDGFDFPQDMIEDLVQETFLGFRQFGLYIGDTYNYN